MSLPQATEDRLVKKLVKLAWPITVSEIAGTLGPTLDMVWIGRLGTAALAGVGLGSAALAVVMNTMVGVSMGLRAMVARHVGTGDRKTAAHVTLHAFALTVGFSLLVALLSLFFADDIIRLLGLKDAAAAEGTIYLRISFFGVAAYSLRLMGETALQASGDTVTPMKLSLLHRSVHALLAPALAFGWLGLPRLGVAGVVTANVVTQGLSFCLAVWVMWSGRTGLRLSLSGFRFAPAVAWRLIRVGIPASVTFVQNDLGGMLIMVLLARFGEVAVAAFVISRRLEMMLAMPGSGLGNAAGIIAGQSLGAGQPQRAIRTGWTAVGITISVMAVFALVVLLGAEPIARLFNSDPELVATATTFLRISTVGYVALGALLILMLVLIATGDTLPPMLILSASLWLGAVLPVFLLTQFTSIGIIGVRWVLVTPAVMTALGLALYYRSGRWTRRKV